jgi:hypothetical protein
VRTFVVEDLDELVEPSLLLQKIPSGQLSGLFLQCEMHAFVAAVLLRVTRLAMQMGTFANNVGLRIEQGRHGIELSTPLLDSSGKKITNIEKNHWTVIHPPGIWDKNYTQNSLEIKGSRGQVVLQLKYLPDRIQIAVEWRDQFGRGQEWSKCGSHSCISPWGSPQTELQNEIVIEPIFKYPSSEHLGKFVN